MSEEKNKKKTTESSSTKTSSAKKPKIGAKKVPTKKAATQKTSKTGGTKNSSFKTSVAKPDKNTVIGIAAAAGILVLILLGLMTYHFLSGESDATIAKAEPVEQPAVTVTDSLGRVSNNAISPAWIDYERTDRPVIVEWQTAILTLGKDGNPVQVKVHFPYVISEKDVAKWQKGEITPQSYAGVNPVRNNILVNPDVENIEGQWTHLEVTKNTPQGLIPRPGLPRFGNEEFTSTHKWVKIQELM